MHWDLINAVSNLLTLHDENYACIDGSIEWIGDVAIPMLLHAPCFASHGKRGAKLKTPESPCRFYPLLASMTEVLWLSAVVAGCFQQNTYHHRCLKPRLCMELCDVVRIVICKKRFHE
jgi:hypothetical protein